VHRNSFSLYRHLSIRIEFGLIYLYPQVVPLDSAILPGYTPIGIHSNHMGITKFEDEDDPGFKSVVGELRRWVKELDQSRISDSGDTASANATDASCT
jgi:protein SERAC1